MVKIAKKKSKKQQDSEVKLTKKDIKKPDAFLEASEKGFSLMTKYQKEIIATLVSILLIGFGISAFNYWSTQRDKEITAALGKVIKLYTAKVDPNYTPKDEEDEEEQTPTFKSEKEKYQKVVTEIQKYLKQFSGGKARLFLQLYLANSYYYLGEYDKALKEYRHLSDITSVKDPIYLPIAEGLLRTAEKLNKAEIGIKALSKFSNQGPEKFRPMAKLRLAEFYERNNMTDRALNIYRQLSKGKSQYKELARRKLALLQN